MTRAPLAGVTVVAMEQAVAAPMCTRVLADFGARVIKVENPNGGDFARDYDDVVNGPAASRRTSCGATAARSRSPSNTENHRQGWTLLHRLLDRADAFVSNLAPGSTARMGIAPADLAARHPNVIPVEIDGYGPGGPHLAQARVRPSGASGIGLVRRHRLPRACPRSPGPRWPTSPPGCTPAISILALLFARDSRPKRCAAPAVELSLFDVMTDVMGYAAHLHPALRHRPAAAGRRLARGRAVRRVSAPATARPSCSAPPTTASGSGWPREIIDRPDLADDPRFATNADRCAHRDDPRRGHRDPGARNTISQRSRRSRTPPESATPATTCRARWWCTRS